jgi:uncharacterized membrane protein
MAVYRGLGVVLPPLLTVAIFLWVGNSVRQYLLEPVTHAAREGLVWWLSDVRRDVGPDEDANAPGIQTAEGSFERVGRTEDFVPFEVAETVRQHLGPSRMPTTASDMYRRYVEVRYLRPWVVIPLFLCVFILLLYLLGKFLAVGIGQFFVNLFDRGAASLPLVRSVYSAIKQVTDLLFSEREIEHTRIVAVEFPSKGIWSIGFVTSDSLLDIRDAADEPVLAVLVPYSPWCMTGCTITVRKSDTVDLNMTVDQAFQFVVSCGVVVPPHQLASLAEKRPPAVTSKNEASRPAGKAPRKMAAPSDVE